MPASLDPQLALDERAITNAELEAALERRLRAKDDVAEVRGVYKVAHKEVQKLIDTVGDFPPDSALRVGRFRITKRHIEADHREFDTSARDQISIGLVDEDGAPARRKRAEKVASVSDEVDLRPTGEVNPAALRGEADRASEPTPIKRPGGQPPAPIQ